MQQSNHSFGLSNCYLHICLNNIEIRHNKKIEAVYFSFVHREKFHFSSTIDSNTSYINDDILIYFQHQDEIPDYIKLQRWQNHIILFEHEIDITDIKTRHSTKKKIQTKQNQIVSLTMNLYSQNEIKSLNSPVKEILQHYLKIFKIFIYDQIKVDSDEISYFQILTRKQKYSIPVINSELIIKLTTQFQILYFRKNKLIGKSQEFFSSAIITKILQIKLFDQKGINISKVKLQLQWITDLSSQKLQSTILHQANQLCIYDIEAKFENHSQYTGAKLKFVYASKAFQINGELNHRVVQFQRIIYLILKSQDEEISIYCEKNNKIVAEAKFNTTEMISHKVITVKKYLNDPVSHRPLGYVRFYCEKAKNLSLPSSNLLWKQLTRKKSPSKIYLRIQQLSVEYNSEKSLFALVKTEKQQHQIDPIINMLNYQPQVGVHEPLLLSINQKISIYIVVRQKLEDSKIDQSQFLGIAAINYQQLRLGSNPLKISFFKNQQLTLQANCIINKIVSYPFIKPYYQNQIPPSPHTKTFPLSVDITKILFQPYFYTFQYQNKTELYCIFQLGKTKKVMVLQQSKQNQLSFQITNKSDSLNFLLNQTQFTKGKLTFLVSSLGKDEQIYGWTAIKIKVSELMENSILKFQNSEIRNQNGIFIGEVSLQIKKGSISSQLMSNKQIRKIKNDMMKVNENIEKVQRSFSKNKSIFLQQIRTPNTERRNQKRNNKSLAVRYVSRKRYSPQNIRLPKI